MNSTKHNEDLKEFLKPMLQSKEALKVKKFGKHMKTYAQVLEIQVVDDKNNENNAQNQNQTKTKKKTEEVKKTQQESQTKTSELEKIMKNLEQ